MLISSLLILLTYLGFKLYSSHLFIFLIVFVLLNFFKPSATFFAYFKKHEKKLLAAIMFFTLLILLRAGIVDEGIIAIQDYPIHYFVHNLMATKMISHYHSINGMYLNYQLGYSPLYDHPPAGPLLSTFLWYLSLKKIPFWAIFRFVVALSFILPIFSIYYLSKTFGFHSFVSILSTILWISWFHEYFIDGTFISYYSLSFGLLSLAFFIKSLNSKEKKYIIISSIFLAFSLLFQSMLYPFFLFSLFLVCVLRKNYKKFMLVFLLSLAIGSIYFANLLSWNYTFQIFSKQPFVFPHMYDIHRAFWLHFYLLSVFPVMLALPLLLYHFPSSLKWRVEYLLLVSIFLILISFSLNFLQTRVNIPIISLLSNIFLLERVSFLNRCFFCILASLSVYYLLTAPLKENFLKTLVLSLLIVYVLTFFHYLFESWYNSESELFEYIYGWKLKDWYSLKLDNGILKNRPKAEVMELFDFLEKNTTKDARIIVEDSRWGKLGGNIMTLLALFTDKFFVGGLHQGVFIEGDTWFVDGVIFGKSIAEYSEDELAKKLEKYNVKWIVVWTNKSKSFLSSLPKFKKIYETSHGLFQVYEYSNLLPSYIYIENGNASLKILNDDKIIVDLFNVAEGMKIVLKFRYEKYWHAFYDGKEIPIEKCEVLMCMRTPASGTYSLTLSYQEGNLLKAGKLISLISLISLFFYLLKTSFIQLDFDKRALGLREKRKLYSI